MLEKWVGQTRLKKNGRDEWDLGERWEVRGEWEEEYMLYVLYHKYIYDLYNWFISTNIIILICIRFFHKFNSIKGISSLHIHFVSSVSNNIILCESFHVNSLCINVFECGSPSDHRFVSMYSTIFYLYYIFVSCNICSFRIQLIRYYFSPLFRHNKSLNMKLKRGLHYFSPELYQ